MSAAVLLERLHGVRRTGPSSWRADCPNGHRQARGSLSVSEADDGRVLMHCFACGDTPGILTVAGLELADLFPTRIADPSPEARRAAHDAAKRAGWSAALGVLAREATVIEIAARDVADGLPLDDADHARLLTACERVHAARAVLT